MPRPTENTDAYEDGVKRRVPIIFLAGPIKHWWTCWGSSEHKAYIEHRDAVRAHLIAQGYLTYAPWDAIKGSWDQRAQAINDMAIATADLLVVLTPTGIPADGTEEEDDYAKRIGTPVLHVPPGKLDWGMTCVSHLVGEGVRY